MSSTLLCEKSVSCVKSDQSVLRLVSYASQQRKLGFFNDIKIKAGNVSESANRLVLACYSEYFQDVFINKLNKDDCLVVDGIDGESLKTLIDYIYEGTITINNENVFRLMSAARKLKLIDVVQYCCRFLESVITYDSCLVILDAAKDCKDTALQIKVIQHIENNFDRVSRTRAFKMLSITDLVYCIRLLKHDQSIETMVYEAIVRWIKHDEDQRRSDFHELFKLIKLDQVSYEYLTDVVLQEKLVNQTATCVKLVSEVLPKVLKAKQDSKSTIVSLGGRLTSKMTEIFSLTNDPPKQYPELPEHLEGHSSLKLNNYVYCIAGKNILCNKTINKVWRLNLNKTVLKWKQIQSIPDNRYVMGAAVYCNTLMVSHGCDERGIISKTNQIYEESSNQWKPISSLQQIRESHQLAVCHGKLFAIGGCYIADQRVLSSVEQLSDLSSSWKYVDSLLTPRQWFAAVTCSGYIYAIGGCSHATSITSLKSVERYDPLSHKWEYVGDMNTERCGHSACVLQNKIYVVGGLDLNCVVVKKIECYDPVKDKWLIVGETNEGLIHSPLVVA